MRDPATTKVANNALKRLCRYVDKNKNGMGEVQRRLEGKTKRQWRRENLERWLGKDPAKRHQPLLGVGLVLLEIDAEIANEG